MKLTYILTICTLGLLSVSASASSVSKVNAIYDCGYFQSLQLTINALKDAIPTQQQLNNVGAARFSSQFEGTNKSLLSIATSMENSAQLSPSAKSVQTAISRVMSAPDVIGAQKLITRSCEHLEEDERSRCRGNNNSVTLQHEHSIAFTALTSLANKIFAIEAIVTAYATSVCSSAR